MDWTDNQQCVLCDKGGNLLVCNDDGCPISVHKNCMGCEAHFDDGGNFHCPYCVYKQYAAEATRLWSKAMLTKKALSTFLHAEKRDGNRQEPLQAEKRDGNNQEPLQAEKRDDNNQEPLQTETRDGNNQEPLQTETRDGNNQEPLQTETRDGNNQEPLQTETRDGNNQEPLQTETRDGNYQESLDTEKRDGNNQEPLQAEKRNGNCQEPVDKSVCEYHANPVPEKTDEGLSRNEEVHGSNDENCCRMMVVYKPNSETDNACNRLQPDVSKRMRVDQQTRNEESTSKDSDQQHDASIEELAASILLTIRKENASKKQNISVTVNMNGRKEQPAMDHVVKNVPNQLPMIVNRDKRSRVLWTEQEEEMLKEGVQKYAPFTKKNLPWRKILEFGRHVFKSSRTPSELKDKWRKLGK